MVFIYVRPAGPGDASPLRIFAPDLGDEVERVVRREDGATGIVFIVTAADEPTGDDPDRSLGHDTPSWDSPGWDSPGWGAPSWTTSPPEDGLAGVSPPGYAEERFSPALHEDDSSVPTASAVPQVVGLVWFEADADRRLVARERRLARGYAIPAVERRLDAFIERFATTNRFEPPRDGNAS